MTPVLLPKASADDRTLVDKTVAPATVWAAAVAATALGISSAAVLAFLVGRGVLYVALPAAVLSWIYTADPLG